MKHHGAEDMLKMRALQMAYWMQRRIWRVVRPHTRGVKVMIFNERGELALVRNSYGDSELFVLPGGGMKRFEEPEAAAAREMREELGVQLENLTFRSRHSSSAEGKRDEVYVFEACVNGPLTIDGFEVAEARFVSPNDIPPTTSPATRRRIQEYLGAREPDGRW